MIVKMIKNLENKMEKMQESMNNDLEDLMNKHTNTLLIVSFDVQKLLRLIRSHLFIFAFISNILGGGS